MRKSDLIKLIFVIVLTIIAAFCCVTAITVRQGFEAAKAEVDSTGEAIGYVFGVAFGILVAVLFAIAGMIANLVSILLCAFGLKAPALWTKWTFGIFLVANIVFGVVSAIGTFAG